MYPGWVIPQRTRICITRGTVFGVVVTLPMSTIINFVVGVAFCYFLVYLHCSTFVPVLIVIVGVWALVQSMRYFFIAIMLPLTTSVIIVSALLVTASVVLLLGGVAHILFVRFSEARTDHRQSVRAGLIIFPFLFAFVVVALGITSAALMFCQKPLNSVQIHWTTISVIRVFRTLLITFSTISSVVVSWHSLTTRVYSTTYLFLCLVVTLPTLLPMKPLVVRLSSVMPNRLIKLV